MNFWEVAGTIIANGVVTGAFVLIALKAKIEARLTRLETYLKIIATKLEIPI